MRKILLTGLNRGSSHIADWYKEYRKPMTNEEFEANRTRAEILQRHTVEFTEPVDDDEEAL